MATVTTASIIERAGILLDDMTHVGWTETSSEVAQRRAARNRSFQARGKPKTAIVSKVAGTKRRRFRPMALR